MNITLDTNITHLQATGHDQIVPNVTLGLRLQTPDYVQNKLDANIDENTNEKNGENTDESYHGSYISVTLLLVGKKGHDTFSLYC